MPKDELEQLRADLAQAGRDLASVLLLVAELREAVGDPEGRLMQVDLLARCRKLAALPAAAAKAEEVLDLVACGCRAVELRDLAKSALAAIREGRP